MIVELVRLAFSQQGEHFVEQRIGTPLNGFRRQTGERVGHHYEPEIRDAPEIGHFPGRGVESIGDDRDRRNAGSFENDGVEQTARRTRSSVPDSGDGEVGPSF